MCVTALLQERSALLCPFHPLSSSHLQYHDITCTSTSTLAVHLIDVLVQTTHHEEFYYFQYYMTDDNLNFLEDETHASHLMSLSCCFEIGLHSSGTSWFNFPAHNSLTFLLTQPIKRCTECWPTCGAEQRPLNYWYVHTCEGNVTFWLWYYTFYTLSDALSMLRFLFCSFYRLCCRPKGCYQERDCCTQSQLLVNAPLIHRFHHPNWCESWNKLHKHPV